MKWISMIFLLVLGASSAFAQYQTQSDAQYEVQFDENDADIMRTITVTGHGDDYRSCNAGQSWCLDQVRRNSEQDGKDDARRTCEINNRGRVVSMGYCSTNCSPNMIPPTGRPVWVQCRSTCQVSCDVNQ